MVEVGTIPDPTSGSTISGNGPLLAEATVLAARPKARPRHARLTVMNASSPAAPSHSAGPALERKPSPKAIPMTTAMLTRVCSALATMRAMRMEGRKIAIVRNRSMMPAVMSTLAWVEMPISPAAAVMMISPGRT